MRLLDQYRCDKAYQDIGNLDSSIKKREYRSRARNFPSAVRRNGLLQSLSGLLSENKPSADMRYAKHICKWLNYAMGEGWIANPTGTNGSVGHVTIPEKPVEAVDYLSNQKASDYLYITEEVIQFSSWLKRAAESLLSDQD